MESRKGAEAGPSKGGVFGDENEETKRTEEPHDHEIDVDEEESDDDDDVAAAGFVPGPLLSLKEQIEKDKEDDSLRRWKEKLLGCLEGDLNEQMEPEVKFHSISIISDDFGEIITPLPINENQSGSVLFTLREGSRYQLKLTFSVLHNIVSGLTYSNSVWKGGLQVDQSKGMLGTFAPQRERYVHLLEEETTPSGALARGNYSARLKFEDDDKRCHIELRYSFEIKKGR
ncbi:rho GDP-dissociation inhibitor 1-like [Tripterygium wilfordii]|uniref:Rho GDP-dissociation inhibitor 1-like n=1 Tax=Tripterygium wilfordii TaxID=458696 RepID=A0A7J7CY00_TRIWF|nr:rho GDP-dissociation inhibitor 1-like [Tripterygium wilfordii]KAF5738971.1 rho GDP-dissociation inhibitor 1-like [Tripterygium wilfordii]